MMSWLADGIIANGVRGVIEDAEKDGKVKELVEVVEKTIAGFIPRDPAGVKARLVKHIIFPFAKLLLRDDPASLEEAKKHAGI